MVILIFKNFILIPGVRKGKEYIIIFNSMTCPLPLYYLSTGIHGDSVARAALIAAVVKSIKRVGVLAQQVPEVHF